MQSNTAGTLDIEYTKSIADDGRPIANETMRGEGPTKQTRATRREVLTLRLGVPSSSHADGQPVAADPNRALSDSDANDCNSCLEHYSHRAMGCHFQILAPWRRQTPLAHWALVAFEEVDRLENMLSMYRADSELSQLNALASHRWCAGSPELIELAALALQLAEETAGAFDPTSTPLSRLWGFANGQPRVPTEDEIAGVLPRVGFRQIALRCEDLSLRWLRPGVELNFNGIGKGYALQRVAEILAAAGVSDWVVHGGQSSVVARGNDPSLGANGGWRIGLSHPTAPHQRLAEIVLRDEAIGTSGSGRQAFFIAGRRYGHVLDPRSGWPAQHALATTVIHRQPAWCDALATACHVMRADEVDQLCARHLDLEVIRVVSGKGEDLILQTWNVQPWRLQVCTRDIQCSLTNASGCDGH